MTAKSQLILLFILIIASLSGCKKEVDETGDYAGVDAAGWAYGDTIRLTLTSPNDSVISGRPAIAVRHSSTYDYSNLWLEITYSDSISPDTVNVRLADSYGAWYGKGLGLSYQFVDTLDKRLCLELPATVSIRHIMRADKLKDIEQIGLVIIP